MENPIDFDPLFEEIAQISSNYEKRIVFLDQSIISLEADIEATNIVIKAVVDQVSDPSKIDSLIRALDNLVTPNNPNVNTTWFFARTYLTNIKRVLIETPEVTYENASEYLAIVTEEKAALDAEIGELQKLLDLQDEFTRLLEATQLKESQVKERQELLRIKAQTFSASSQESIEKMVNDPRLAVVSAIDEKREKIHIVSTTSRKLKAIQNTNLLTTAILRERREN